MRKGSIVLKHICSQKEAKEEMRKGRLILLVWLAVAAIVAAASGPAMAAWPYTSANPLVFEFTDNNSSVFVDPYNYPPTTTNAFWTQSTDSSCSFGNVIYRVAGTRWNCTFSPDYSPGDSRGSLAIQSNNYNGGLCLVRTCNMPSANPPGTFPSTASVNWTQNGMVFKIKCRSIGDINSSWWPAGYTWGGNYGLGGLEINLFKLPGGGTNAKSAALVLSWLTYDPTTQLDDTIGVFDKNGWATTATCQTAYPLGGTPTTPPEHEYTLTVQQSPLPLPANQLPGTMLVNVYVDGVRLIKNKTVTITGGDGYDYVDIGNRVNGAGRRGDQYDYVKIYEGDPVSDSDSPTVPANVQAIAPTCESVQVSWTESTDPTTEVVGYRVYDGAGNFLAYSDALECGLIRLTPSTPYSFKVSAVDRVGNESAQSAAAAVTTPAPYTGNTLTFNLSDNDNSLYKPTSNPRFFCTIPSEPGAQNWLGRRYATDDRWLPHTWRVNGGGLGRNQYKVQFSSAGGMTVQTESKSADQQSFILGANEFQYWYKWICDTSVTPAYYRGVKGTIDFDMVAGDEPDIPVLPTVRREFHRLVPSGQRLGRLVRL